MHRKGERYIGMLPEISLNDSVYFVLIAMKHLLLLSCSSFYKVLSCTLS